MTDISIHALREEGDNFLLRTWHKADDFYPRPPRGGRPSTASTFTLTAYFYPRPPRGGRQLPQWVTTMIMNFYPRPPRGGRPRLRVLDPFVLEISIHALREEGDAGREGRRGRPGNFYPRPPRGGRLQLPHGCQPGLEFLSTPSARRATRQAFQVQKYYEISIHALREEGDLGRGSSKQSMANFYPRPPRGGRQFFPVLPEQSIGFLSTPSARRATLCGRIRNQKDIRFLSTPSARRATPAQ